MVESQVSPEPNLFLFLVNTREKMDTSHKKKSRRINAKTCEAIIASSNAKKEGKKKKNWKKGNMFDIDAREVDAVKTT